MGQYKYIIALAILAASSVFSYNVGYDQSEVIWQARYIQDTEKLTADLKTAQNNERAAYAAQEAIEADLLARLKEQEANANNTISDLRAGNVRLRESLAVKSCPSLSASTGSTGSSDAASTGGLSEADVGFFIREAERADQLAEQLKAAQQVIIQDRMLCGSDS